MRLVVSGEELPDRRPAPPPVALRSKPLDHLVERQVGRRPQRPQDEVGMRIEHRALRLALFGRSNVALRALQPTPGARRRYPDRIARRRLTRRHPVLYRPNYPLPQIQAVRLAHRFLRHWSMNRIILPLAWE